MGLFYSPLNAVAEYYAVCGIVRRKCRVAILHAEHHERICAVVAHTAFCRRVPRAPHCLLCRERPVRQLELSLYAEEEIKFLMLLVGVVITFAALYRCISMVQSCELFVYYTIGYEKVSGLPKPHSW